MNADDSRSAQELLAELRAREQDIDRLNVELAETNRGVVALYAELDDRAEDLKRASESKSRFLSMISHELRTPLTSVLNVSRLLLDRLDGELTSEQERQITLIRNSVSALTEMVNDLLDLAKIEAGKTTLRIASTSVADLLTGLRGIFRPVLLGDAVALVLDDPDEPISICTDEGKLAQVLRNFISNAVKFTVRGEVRLTAAVRDGERVTFEVSDTGVGISPEDQSAIFKDFVQVENPLQRHVKGTGLGLSLSAKIADLLAGDIGVRSEVGVGSTFWLTIPLTHPRALPGCAETSIDVAVGPATAGAGRG